MHDNITRALAVCYFQLGCDLFIRLPRGYKYWGSDDRYTDIARKYISTTTPTSSLLSADESKIAERLKAGLPPSLPGLQGTLADAANNAIDDIENNFDTLTGDNPTGNPPEEVLRNVQYHYDFLRELAREGIEGTVYRPGESETVRKVKNRLDASWRQRYRTLPTEKWRSRACRLGSESDPMAALAFYQALRNDMAYLEEAIGEAAIDLDVQNQLEIDHARLFQKGS